MVQWVKGWLFTRPWTQTPSAHAAGVYSPRTGGQRQADLRDLLASQSRQLVSSRIQERPSHIKKDKVGSNTVYTGE